MDNHQVDKENRKKSLYITLGIHGALLILFFFLLAWKEPFPPIPEYGIELNFGIDSQGTGSVQQQAPPSQEPSEELEPIEESTESTNETANEPNEAPIEATEEEAVEETQAQEIESPDVVEEAVEEYIESEEVSNNEAAAESEESKVVVDKVEVPEESNPGGANQGDDTNEVGDKGNPEGEIDERALYGNPGAGGGASLDMAGWMWDYIPTPNDQSDENGKIVFAITIDDSGEILSIRTLEKTVTPAVERIYRAEVEQLTFSTTRDNTLPAATSSGTITFIIKSN